METFLRGELSVCGFDQWEGSVLVPQVVCKFVFMRSSPRSAGSGPSQRKQPQYRLLALRLLILWPLRLSGFTTDRLPGTPSRFHLFYLLLVSSSGNTNTAWSVGTGGFLEQRRVVSILPAAKSRSNDDLQELKPKTFRALRWFSMLPFITICQTTNTATLTGFQQVLC